MPPGFRLSPTSAAAIAGFPVDPWRGDDGGGGTRGMQAVAADMATDRCTCVRTKELVRRPSVGANEQRGRGAGGLVAVQGRRPGRRLNTRGDGGRGKDESKHPNS